MRMWGVDVKILCRQHLLGEHLEMHMFAGAIKKKISLAGYIKKGLVNPRMIKIRHDALVTEMLRRRWNHKSKLDMDCSQLPDLPIDVKMHEKELLARCDNCNNCNIINLQIRGSE